MRSLLWAILVLACVCRAETLVFEDNFDELDVSRWEHELTLGGGGNWEFEYYTNNRTNSYVRDGVLYLRPTLTADKIGMPFVENGYTMDIWGTQPAGVCTGNAFYGCSRTSGGGNIINPIQSARIRSVNSFTMKYGRVEIRARMPRGDWIWPALWMLPRWNAYGEWPASGEIDIVESRGNTNYPDGGSEAIGSTLHWGPYWGADPYQLTHGEKKLTSGDFHDQFHTFGLIWTKTSIVTYIDSKDNIVLNVDMSKNNTFWDLGKFPKDSDNPWAGRPGNAPFDQSFYFVFNVAVGGTGGYFPDGVGNKPWSDKSQHAAADFWNARGAWMPTWKGEDTAMAIDYVRAWSL